jgi:membrane protein YdbS with pleckstrin-like domain
MGGYDFLGVFFQPAWFCGAVVVFVAFVGVWQLWLYHALPIYLSIYLI